MKKQRNISVTKQKKTSATKLIFNILFYVFLGIIFIALFFFVIYNSINLSNNRMPSIFGQSYCRILSNSMSSPVYKNGELISDGFEKGDVIFIEEEKISNIEIYDVIAFYDCPLNEPDFEHPGKVIDFMSGENSFDTNIIFHQVVDIEVDSEGYVWFQTKGTSNTIPDGYVRSDYVIGVYKPSYFANILQFVTSPMGIVALVIIPSGVIMFFLLVDIINIVDQMIKEKKPKNKVKK